MRRRVSKPQPPVQVLARRDGRFEVSVRISKPLGPARSEYLRRVLASVGGNVVIALGLVRTDCTPENVAAAACVLGPLAERARHVRMNHAPALVGATEAWTDDGLAARTLTLIERFPGISVSEIANLLGVGVDTAQRIVRRLAARLTFKGARVYA